MTEKKRRGKLAELAIITASVERGYRVSIPLDDDAPYDIVVDRRRADEGIQRVQCKFTSSDGKVVQVRCRATNSWSEIRYTPDTIDWIAVYDATTRQSYFVPAAELGVGGRTMMHLRLAVPANGQASGVRWARDYLAW